VNSTKNISGKKILIRSVLITLIVSVVIISTVSVFNLKKIEKIQDLKTNKTAAEKIAEKISFEFEKAILISQLSARITNTIQNPEDLKTILKTIVNSDKRIKKTNLFLGDISLLENIKNNFLRDTLNNFIFLSSAKKENNIQFSSFNADEFKLNPLNLKKLTKSKNVLISEPLKIKNGKKSEYLIGFTSPLHQNAKLTGFISVFYSAESFASFISENKQAQYNFFLLSPEKNIIASRNMRNIGKNILNLHEKESELYNQLHHSKKNVNGNISKISPAGTESEFEFLYAGKIFFDKKNNNLLIYFISISFIILISGILFILYITNNLFAPLKKIFRSLEMLSKGAPVAENLENFKYEYKDAAENLNKISKFQTEISAFAEHIISENFEIHLDKRSEYDKTSEALNTVSKYLKDKKQKQITEEKEISRQLWMRKGRFEISEAERFSSKDIEDLSYNIIRSVVNYIDALMGGIYLYDKNNDIITLVAAYAYNQQKHFNASFKPGEGIVGACVLEKKKVVLKNIPEDYIKIATGLGSGRPSYIAVIPILFKNEINAAVEVAFMNKPEDYKIEFIEQLSDSIGSWIDASLVSTKTGELLSVSQEQTQKLAEKEEELNKKVLELQEIQEKTNLINARYKSMLNAVNQTIMTVEYTLDGTIINCNQVYTEIMGFMPEDIKGKNVSELVKDQSESLKQIIEEVKTGKTIKKEVKRYTKEGKEKTLTATYTPYFDKEGKISQILFFAFDISNINN